MQNKENIALIGMMGSGKTTIGEFLAKKLKKSFLDLDNEIEKQQQQKINDIFAKNGEDFFRELESKNLKNICTNNNNYILSCGGGSFNKKENRILLAKHAIVIYLKTDIDILVNRVKLSDARPLLKSCNLSDKLTQLFKEREKYYLDADIEICTNNSDINLITNQIITKLNAQS